MIASILVPVIFLSIFLTQNSKNYYKQYIGPVLEENIKKDIISVENFFEDSEDELNIYSQILALEDSDVYIYDLLDKVMMQNETFKQVFYVKTTGETYINNHVIAPVDGRERLWYKDAVRSGEFSISKPYSDAITSDLVLTLSIPVYKEDSLLGVFGVDFFMKDIVQNIAKITDLSHSRYILKNATGEIIYYDSSIQNLEIAEKILKEANEPLYYYSESLQLQIYIVLSSEAYYLRFKEISQDMAILFIVVIIITTLISLNIAKKLNAPLNEFKNKVIQLNEPNNRINNYDTVHWDEEFHLLFTKYNKLSKKIELDREKLSYRIEILQEKNDRLIEKNIDLEDSYKNLKVIDKKLRKSRDDYESILENINGLVWVLDSNGNITFINSHLKALLNYEERTLIGETIDKLICNDYKEHIQVIDLISGRDYKKIELNLIDSKGNKILVEGNTSRVFDTDGSLLYIYGICKDVKNIKELHYNYNVKIEEQNLIMELTETASKNISLTQVTQAIFEKINSIFGWSIGTIRFLNENNEFELIASTDIGSEYISDYSLDSEFGCLNQVIEKNEILYINNLEELPVKEKIYSRLIEEGYSIIFIPVGNNDIGKGVITLTIDRKAMVEKEEILRSFTNTILIVVERALIYEKLKKDYIRMIKVLAEAGDDKDSSSVGHSNRVANYSKAIGELMYLEDEEIIDLEICGLLHDIGKIGISDEYLSKEAQKNEVAREKVKAHPEIGRKMLSGIGLSEYILDGIEMHHMNFDLSGYPKRDFIDTLPLFPRIIQVADHYDNCKLSGLYSSNMEIWQSMDAFTGEKFCPQIMRIFKEVLLREEKMD